MTKFYRNHKNRRHDGTDGEKRYSSTLSLTSADLSPGKKPRTYCREVWVGFVAGLNGHGKSRRHRCSNSWPSSP